MNETLVVDVSVPVLGQNLEFTIPSIMMIDTVKQLIVKIISTIQPGFDEGTENLWLLDINTKKMLPPDLTCNEAGINNGSRLMLISVE